MPHISVVLPCYRTAQYLRELHQRLVATLETCSDGFELIMVDDGSPDDCWAIITDLAAKDVRVKGLRLSRNFGQQAAIGAGLEAATGNVIVSMDADLQDRPEDIPLLLQHLRGEIDVVHTVKANAAEPFSTRLTSHIFHRVFSKVSGRDVPRNIGTLRLFSRRFLEALLAYPERNIVYGPVMFHVGFKSCTVEIPREERLGSRSSYSFRKRMNLAINVLISYTDLPQRFLVWSGVIVLLSTTLYSLVLVGQYLIIGRLLLPGLTPITLLVALSMGATMTGLGIVGMYVFRVYQEVLCRPRHIVALKVNFGDQKE